MIKVPHGQGHHARSRDITQCLDGGKQSRPLGSSEAVWGWSPGASSYANIFYLELGGAWTFIPFGLS